jgi:hypothetical protein
MLRTVRSFFGSKSRCSRLRALLRISGDDRKEGTFGLLQKLPSQLSLWESFVGGYLRRLSASQRPVVGFAGLKSRVSIEEGDSCRTVNVRHKIVRKRVGKNDEFQGQRGAFFKSSQGLKVKLLEYIK